MDQVYCVLDYETFSEADLKKVGGYEYSVHPSTEIICVAWRVGTRETLRTATTYSWCPTAPSAGILSLLDQFRNSEVTLVARNAFFEQVITRNVLGRILHTQVYLKDIPPGRWTCTASLAAALALPRSLEGTANALKLPVKKDMDGRRLVLKWCKPRKPTKKDPSARHTDPDELERLIRYCKTDVEVDTEAFLRCPPLTPTERRVWVLDQEINLRGIAVDRPLVTTVLDLIEEETGRLNAEVSGLTFGALDSATKRDRVLAWLEDEGLYLPDLTKKTVEDTLASGLATGAAKRMLEIRQATAKTSTAKYQAFDDRSKTDGRLRDILVYHAATTGRWGGSGVQLQNLPRGTIKDSIAAAEVLADGDLEWVRLLYGDPMRVFSSCLRNVLVAPPGKTLDVADYNAVELRVAFWVAKHEEGLKTLREGRDLYRELASKIYRKPITDINGAQRFVGKTAQLGCVYGMGKDKFAATCLSQGQDLPRELSDLAVDTFREVNAPVVKLWAMLELAARSAIENPGRRYTINRTAWSVKGGFLWCQLPSGRKLAYAEPSVQWDTVYGRKRPVIYYWATDGLTKQWTRQKTWGGVLTENVVQAVARDLMAEAMLRIEESGIWRIVLSVHDELIAERDPKTSSLNAFCKLMAKLPAWAEDCPISVEGWTGTRYRK